MKDNIQFILIADEVAAQLQHLMQSFPHLVTENITIAVANWTKFKQWNNPRGVEQAQRQAGVDTLLAKSATALLEKHQIEDAMEILAERFSTPIDYPRFIALIGHAGYRSALRHEIKELQDNAISFQQMADLWNSLGKPTLGGNRWTAHSVSMLVE
jgi:hypothetical protein